MSFAGGSLPVRCAVYRVGSSPPAKLVTMPALLLMDAQEEETTDPFFSTKPKV
jgi:hypothetical protein